jgi:hypothetical protein
VSRARQLALLLLAGALCAASEPVVPPRLAAWLDIQNDQLVRKAFVPNPAQRIGEVRIIRRADATVVETLIYSKVPSRVIGEIRKKELANWPGNADAAAYLEALEKVQKTVEGSLPGERRGADRRHKIWIDFVLAPEAAFIAMGSFESEVRNGKLEVVSRETLAVLEPSREYVERNQRLIAADSFHVQDAATLLPEHWK